MVNVATVGDDIKKFGKRHSGSANNIVSAHNLGKRQEYVIDKLAQQNAGNRTPSQIDYEKAQKNFKKQLEQFQLEKLEHTGNLDITSEEFNGFLNSIEQLYKAPSYKGEEAHPILKNVSGFVGSGLGMYEEAVGKVKPPVDNPFGAFAHDVWTFLTGANNESAGRERINLLLAGNKNEKNLLTAIHNKLQNAEQMRMMQGQPRLKPEDVEALISELKNDNLDTYTNLEKVLKGKTKLGIKENLSQGAAFHESGAFIMGNFFVAPWVSMALYKFLASPMLQSGNMLGAQTVALGAKAIGHIPGVLVAGFTKGCNPEQLQHLPLWAKLCLPLIRTATLVSHIPIFDMLRTVVDFKGEATGESNWAGKACEAADDFTGFFRFASGGMFVANHWNHLNGLKAQERLNPELKNLNSHKLDKVFQWGGIAFNAAMFIGGFLSTLGNYVFLKPAMKKFEQDNMAIEKELAPAMQAFQAKEEALKAKYGPIMEAIQQKLMPILQKEAMKIKTAVESGRMSQEEAKAQIQILLTNAQKAMDKAMPMEAKRAIESLQKAKEVLYAKYQQKAEPLKAEQARLDKIKWALSALGWISNFGIGLQMAFGGFQREMVASYRNVESKAGGQPTTKMEGIKNIWNSFGGYPTDMNWMDKLKKPIHFGLVMGVVPIGGLTAAIVSGLGTVAGQGSPFEDLKEKNGIIGAAHSLNQNLGWQFVSGLFMT
jgi:polyhydroxyalkanoate synthesis regulator phasin